VSSSSFLPPLRAALLGLAALTLAAAPAPAAEAVRPPMTAKAAASTVVVGFYDALLATMKEGPALKFQGRFDRLSPAVSAAFDLPAMTRVAAGAQWPSLKPEDQQRLIEAFSHFSIATYAANFDSFGGERFEVLRETPAPNGGGATIVETRLTPKSGDPVQLNYLVRPGKSGLGILDVYVNGTISELAARRSEFASVLNSKGADGLYQLLETRSRELAAR